MAAANSMKKWWKPISFNNMVKREYCLDHTWNVLAHNPATRLDDGYTSATQVKRRSFLILYAQERVVPSTAIRPFLHWALDTRPDGGWRPNHSLNWRKPIVLIICSRTSIAGPHLRPSCTGPSQAAIPSKTAAAIHHHHQQPHNPSHTFFTLCAQELVAPPTTLRSFLLFIRSSESA